MKCDTPDNPHCQFPYCLDDVCDARCIRQEYIDFASRAKKRKRAKDELEAIRQIENEMDG